MCTNQHKINVVLSGAGCADECCRFCAVIRMLCKGAEVCMRLLVGMSSFGDLDGDINCNTPNVLQSKDGLLQQGASPFVCCAFVVWVV